MARLLSFLIALSPALLAAGEVLDVAPDLYAPRVAAERDPAKAAGLVAQAKDAAEAGEVSAALQLATRALRFDPDEPTCRNVLGYEEIDGRWLTAFQRKQNERGFVWHARFGWLKAEDLPRYVAGERRDKRRWLSADEDNERRRLIEEGWRVRTDHFQVTTNHSLEAAATLAADLETLFQVWRQLFAGYYLGEAEVRARFAGTRTARSRSRPFNVFYHRTKAGYVAHLRHKQPRIEITEGIYFDDTREAHFFAKGEGGEGKAESGSPFHLPPSAVHEAVHQLFQESKRAKRGVGGRGNYWAVEGVACYFESLTQLDGGRFEIGGADAGRLPNARLRLLHPDPSERYLLPFDEMATLGRRDLQRRADLPRLYGQTAAVATFLMHAGDEDRPASRREAFVRYLAELYAGRAREDGLAAALGEPLDDVQRAYTRWLERLPR